MSCRSTPGGRAASGCATAVTGRSADDASWMLHRIRRELRAEPGFQSRPATPDEVQEALENLRMQTRHAEGITENRRRRTLDKIGEAADHYTNPDADGWPTNDTVTAWRELPARLAAAPARPAPPGPATYHLQFGRFKRGVLDATNNLFQARPSRLDPEQRAAAFQQWADSVCRAYNITPPRIVWDTTATGTGGGYYTPSTHTITLSPERPSVITLLHETRHALQHAPGGPSMISRDVEIDARAWSLSLYYKVRPALFRKLARQGRILHIAPNLFPAEETET